MYSIQWLLDTAKHSHILVYRAQFGIGVRQSAHRSRICNIFAVLHLELRLQPTVETRLQTLLEQ